MKILVTGATGIIGSTIIKTLLTGMNPGQISILTRKEEKRLEFETKGFNAFPGDYDDLPALEKAMENVDTVLLISAGDEGNRMQQHKNVIDSAVKSGVKSIAYTSRSLQNRDTLQNKLMEDHFLTEELVKESGLNYILFQNALYMDTIFYFTGKDVFDNGISQPAGNGKTAFALRREQGEAIANVLLKNKFENKIYRFTGSQAYSFYDIADALSDLSGKKVTYTAVEIAGFTALMKQRGLPDGLISKIADFNTDIKNGQESFVNSDLERELGRKPADLKEGLKEIFGL